MLWFLITLILAGRSQIVDQIAIDVDDLRIASRIRRVEDLEHMISPRAASHGALCAWNIPHWWAT